MSENEVVLLAKDIISSIALVYSSTIPLKAFGLDSVLYPSSPKKAPPLPNIADSPLNLVVKSDASLSLIIPPLAAYVIPPLLNAGLDLPLLIALSSGKFRAVAVLFITNSPGVNMAGTVSVPLGCIPIICRPLLAYTTPPRASAAGFSNLNSLKALIKLFNCCCTLSSRSSVILASSNCSSPSIDTVIAPSPVKSLSCSSSNLTLLFCIVFSNWLTSNVKLPDCILATTSSNLVPIASAKLVPSSSRPVNDPDDTRSFKSCGLVDKSKPGCSPRSRFLNAAPLILATPCWNIFCILRGVTTCCVRPIGALPPA